MTNFFKKINSEEQKSSPEESSENDSPVQSMDVDSCDETQNMSD